MLVQLSQRDDDDLSRNITIHSLSDKVKDCNVRIMIMEGAFFYCLASRVVQLFGLL